MRNVIWGLRKHRNFWLDWFGSSGRWIGPSKLENEIWYTDNPSIFTSTVEHSISTRHHCFMSVQPFRAPTIVFGLEKVFFDFGSKRKHPNIEETFMEVSGFTERLREHFDVEPLVVKTRSGFHVYVFLRDVVEFGFGREDICELIYRLLQGKLLENVPYSSLSRGCLGNLNQLARVPYSVYKSGVKCLPIDFDGRLIHIYDLSEYRKGGITRSLFRLLVGEGSERLVRNYGTLKVSARPKHSTELETGKADILERAKRIYDECKRLVEKA